MKTDIKYEMCDGCHQPGPRLSGTLDGPHTRAQRKELRMAEYDSTAVMCFNDVWLCVRCWLEKRP